MNPSDEVLLRRAVKVSEENNQILKKMQRAARWALAWTFVKIAIVAIPLILGYIYLSPYFGELKNSYTSFQEITNILSR